jgi:hypothetical protein
VSENLTHKSMAVLEALARYRYLTIPQMALAGVSKSERSIREKILPRLKRGKKKLVDWRDFGVLPGRGRLHWVYCLNENGARVLADDTGIELSKIPYTVGGIKFLSDYDHRLALIDFHIGLKNWVDRNDGKLIFETYFDKVPFLHVDGRAVRFIGKTTIPLNNIQDVIAPDGICKFSVNGKVRLCAVEIHHNNLTGRIVEQIVLNIQAVKSNTIKDRYEHDKASFILSIYDDENTMKLVKQRMIDSPDIKGCERVLIFNTLSNLKFDFCQGWHFVDNMEARLFPVNG